MYFVNSKLIYILYVAGSSVLSSTLCELQQLSYSQFLSLLQTSVTAQLAKSELGDGSSDLSPSYTTSSLLGLLRCEIIQDQIGKTLIQDFGKDQQSIISICFCLSMIFLFWAHWFIKKLKILSSIIMFFFCVWLIDKDVVLINALFKIFFLKYFIYILINNLFRDVLSGHSVVESSQADLPVVVRAVVDPLTLHLQETALKLPKQDAAVFLLNNFHPLRSTLSLYQSDDKRLLELNKRMETCILDLVREQTSYILLNLELVPILSIISQVEFFHPFSRNF